MFWLINKNYFFYTACINPGPADVCSAIFGCPGVISGRKNANTSTNGSTAGRH